MADAQIPSPGVDSSDSDFSRFSTYDARNDSVLTDSQAVKLATGFLETNKNDWQAGDTTVMVKPFHVTSGYTKSGHVKIVMFKQFYDDLPVYHGRLYISFLNNGQLQDINNHLVYGIDIDTTPAISSDEAYRTILSDTPGLAEDNLTGMSKELGILAGSATGNLRLCWSFTISTRDITESWYCQVDAISGEIISCAAERDP